MTKIKVIHIIVGLNVGGAETMLYKLLKYSDRSMFDFEVISLMDKGVYGPKIEELGIPVHTLGIKRGSINILALKKAKHIVKDADIIQTWMYHADLLGYFIRKYSKGQKLIWGIRHSNLEKKYNKKLLLIIAKLNAFLSKKVDLVISCSKNASQIHQKFGYNSSKMIIIPNGFELETFQQNQQAKNSVKNELCIPTEQQLMVHIGRWNAQKDYPNLIKAIKLVQLERPDVNFLLCGTDIEEGNKDLTRLISEIGIKKSIYLLGKRNDIPRILSSADGVISSSLGEGFSNVIGEAMACEIPCVVTDVGDSGYIVDKFGIVVPSRDPVKLAEAILNLSRKSDKEKKELGRKARERIMNEFEIKKIVNKFEEQYSKVISSI